MAEGGTQRAHSNAPIAQQCQWFLSNLVAQDYAPGLVLVALAALFFKIAVALFQRRSA